MSNVSVRLTSTEMSATDALIVGSLLWTGVVLAEGKESLGYICPSMEVKRERRVTYEKQYCGY